MVQSETKTDKKEQECADAAEKKQNKIKVLFLGGVFAKENEQEVIHCSKKGVEFSANLMQMKLIGGLKSVGEIEILSAPFIGSFPNYSSQFYFHGFQKQQSLCEYVSFCNLWGIRNFSRSHALKEKLKRFIQEDSDQKVIIVYSAHTPFLAAAAFAKKRDPRIKICFVVPDLPQYMNLEKHSALYDLCKKADILAMKRHMEQVDAAVVLTDAMAAKMGLEKIPHFTAEGVIETLPVIRKKQETCTKEKETIEILYAGKLHSKFGVKKLVDAFSEMPNPEYRLLLCGNGDMAAYIQKKSQEDKRINYLGQISPQQVQEYMLRADVLINPRPNDEDYTRYSFPSKNIEFLMSGKPVAAYMLDGMPHIYKEFIYEIHSDMDAIHAIQMAITEAAHADQSEIDKRFMKFWEYADKNLRAEAVAEKMLNMIFDQESGVKLGEKNKSASAIYECR